MVTGRPAWVVLLAIDDCKDLTTIFSDEACASIRDITMAFLFLEFICDVDKAKT